MATRLDHATLYPLDREIEAALVAAKLVPGEECRCLDYIQVYRAELLARQGAKDTQR